VGCRVSGSGAVSAGYREGSVNDERKFPLLPLRSHALVGKMGNWFKTALALKLTRVIGFTCV